VISSKGSVETIRNCFRHSGFKTVDKTGDENEHSLSEKPVELSEEVYKDWIDVVSLHFGVATEEDICNAVMNPQTIEQADTEDKEENSKAPIPPIKYRNCRRSSVPRRAVQHRADEKGFEQHYSYETMVMKLLDSKQQATINYFT